MTRIAYRVVASPGSTDEWFDDASGADEAVAQHLGLVPGEVQRLRQRITVDPVVIRRDGARWRSRQVWNVAAATASVRIFEMLLINEELYEH